jgi:hypothetical protein
LSHTADLSLGDVFTIYSPGTEMPSLREKLTMEAIPVRKPAEFSYSNKGYKLLELVIEEVTGQSFSEYMQMEVLSPLGMKNSSFNWSNTMNPASPTGYDLSGKPVPVYVYPEKASGGLFSTAEDIARFALGRIFHMSANDFDFDRKIIDHRSELYPSEEEIRNMNPWSKPIGLIIWGFILTTLHLNFLYLQYIMPTIGVILLFLGFQSLKHENKYFRAAWILSILKLILQLGNLIKVTTPLNVADYPELVMGIAMLAFQIIMFMVFRTALHQVYENAGTVSHSDPLLWASLWTIAAFLIALSPLSHSWLVFIPMVICYVFIVRSLYHLGSEMDDAGYVLTNAPVTISNRTFGWAYFTVALAMVITCCTVYNHLRLEPEEYHPPQSTAARQHLLDMSFPEQALQHLSDEDISMISGAVNIEVFRELLMFDAREVEHQETEGGSVQVTVTREPGVKNIEALTVYMEMPEDMIYILQYFTWQGGQPIWQDAIQILGEHNAKDWRIVSSGLFYTRKGVDYIADFPRLVCEKRTQTGIFGTSDLVQIAGALSYPFGSQHQGGYVLYGYRLLADSDKYMTAATLNYVHLSSPLHIPYAYTEERILSGEYFFSDTKQQHYTIYESLAAR